jgi:S-adenosylmethionine/arginine decarboxylase-like enzyme
MEGWGEELIIDCRSCDLDRIKSEENIRAFLKEFVPAIDMVAYGEPMVAHFAQHDETKSGYSFCQMIETSAITAHLVDKNGDMYLNIFSCKKIPVDIAKKVIDKYFAPTTMKTMLIGRGEIGSGFSVNS